MDKYYKELISIDKNLKCLNEDITTDLFFENTDLAELFNINNLFEELEEAFYNYKTYIDSLKPKIANNLFEEELLNEFIIK